MLSETEQAFDRWLVAHAEDFAAFGREPTGHLRAILWACWTAGASHLGNSLKLVKAT